MKPLVSKITQTNFIDAKGNVTSGFAVVFMVGPHGPFTIDIAQDQFSAAEVLRQTNAFASELAQIPMGS